MKVVLRNAAILVVLALACPLVWATDPAIVFVDEAKAGAKAIMVMDADGSNRREILRTEKRFCDCGGPRLSPSISPDGGQVSYIKAEDAGYDVRKISVYGGDSVVLFCGHRPEGNVVPETPQWSPNGSEIAVVLFDFFHSQAWVALVPEEGVPCGDLPDERYLLDYERFATGVAWSPDGSQIAFLEGHEDGGDQLTILDRETLSIVDSYGVVFPAGSFDGVTWLEFSGLDWQRSGDLVFAFDIYSEGPVGRYEEAWLLRVDAGSVPPVAVAEEIGEGQSPTWSPDDSQLLLGASRVEGSPEDMTLVSVPTGESVFFGSGYDPDWKRGPVTACGDSVCEGAENQCNCSADCGAYPSVELLCDDSVDNDCDGDVDCDDSDCTSDPVCAVPYCGDGTCDEDESPCNCVEDCDPAPVSEAACNDGEDNDCDGLADCDDPDCSDDAICIGGLPGDPCASGADCISGLCHPKKKVCK